MSTMVNSRPHQFKVHKCLIVLTLALSVLPFIPPVTRNVHAEAVTGTVAVGVNPDGIAVDNATNKIYVSNYGNNGTFPSTVSVINGTNNRLSATILVGVNPAGLGVNSVNNRIYVANYNSSNVSVIDGSTNTVVATIVVGTHPSGVSVNIATNKVYVANSIDGTVSVVDGFSNTVVANVSFPLGTLPGAVGVDSVTNEVYVANSGLRTVSVISGHLTTTSLTCTPSSLPVNSITTCSAVVTDVSGSGASTPTGTIFFSSNGTGSFSTNTCSLSGTAATAACSVSYSPTSVGSGIQSIFSTYGGDAKHMSSSDNTILTVTTSTVGGTEIPINKLALLAPFLPPTLLVLGVMLGIFLLKKRRSEEGDRKPMYIHMGLKCT